MLDICSFPIQMLFWWGQGLIVRGYQDLQINDKNMPQFLKKELYQGLAFASHLVSKYPWALSRAHPCPTWLFSNPGGQQHDCIKHLPFLLLHRQHWQDQTDHTECSGCNIAVVMEPAKSSESSQGYLAFSKPPADLISCPLSLGQYPNTLTGGTPDSQGHTVS